LGHTVEPTVLKKTNVLFLLLSRIVHGLFGTTLEDVLKQVNQFLQQHPKEIIILDLQHIFTRAENQWAIIQDQLKRAFNRRIRFADNLDSYTIQEFWEKNISVIAFLSTSKIDKKDSIAHALIKSPFDYTTFTQTSSWLNFLDLNYKTVRRQPRTFYVTQGIMQPHWMEILIAGISENATLKNWVSKEATRKITKWLENKKIGKNRINIVIADFIEYFNYTDTIIKLNQIQNKDYMINCGQILHDTRLASFYFYTIILGYIINSLL